MPEGTELGFIKQLDALMDGADLDTSSATTTTAHTDHARRATMHMEGG